MTFILGNAGTLYVASDTAGRQQLWIRHNNGTTLELTSGDYPDPQSPFSPNAGVNPSDFFALSPSRAIFVGYGPVNVYSLTEQLWVTDGTVSGTYPISALNIPVVSGTVFEDIGLDPSNFVTLFNNDVGFQGATGVTYDNGEGIIVYGHYVTDGSSVWLQANQSFVLATASVGNVSFGVHHVGDPLSGSSVVENSAPANGYSEALDGDVAGDAGGVSASGSFNQIEAGSSVDIAVSMASASTGVVAGTATVALESDGAGIDGRGTTSLTSQTIQVTATLYAYAAPSLTPTIVNLGAVRVGGTTLSSSTTLSNGTVASAYQESLIYALSGAPAAFGFTNASGTIASGGSRTIDVTLGAVTAGNFTGSAATLALTSTGAGTSGLANTTLTTETLTLNGRIYAPAVATLGTSSLAFGVVHVGDVVSKTVTVTNEATGALTDVLTGGSTTLSGNYGGAVSFSPVSGVAAGASGTVSFGLTATSAGVISGGAILGFTSHDSDLSDLAINGGTVTVTGTVDNYAVMTPEEVGNPAPLTLSAGVYSLDLGAVALGGGALTANLGVLNSATGPVDLLSGSLSATGGAAFTNTGFGAFSGLDAGQADTAPVISLATTTPGTYSETITLSGTGSNASGFFGPLTAETLVATGTITGVGPTITGAVAGQHTNVGDPISPTSTVTITDPIVDQMETVTVALSAPTYGTFTNLSGGNYNSTTGVYTDTGTAAEVTAALDGLVFKPSVRVQLGLIKSPLNILINTGFTITDTDTAGASASDATTTVSYSTGIGTFAPAINGTAAGQTTTDDAVATPFSNVAIIDFNSNPTETVTVTLSAAENGVLTDLGGGTYDASTGVYADTGTAAAVTAAVDGLVFTPTAHQVAPNQTVTTTFTIGDTSSAGTSTTDSTTTVIATAVAVAPTVTAAGTVTFDGGGPAVPLDPGLTLADLSSTTLVSATVTVGGYVPGDTLTVGTPGDLTASFSGGILTLSGSAGLATYQTALDSVAYSFTAGGDPSADGSDASRSITWAVNDGVVSSATASSTLAIITTDFSAGALTLGGWVTEFVAGNTSTPQTTNEFLTSGKSLAPATDFNWGTAHVLDGPYPGTDSGTDQAITGVDNSSDGNDKYTLRVMLDHISGEPGTETVVAGGTSLTESGIVTTTLGGIGEHANDLLQALHNVTVADNGKNDAFGITFTLTDAGHGSGQVGTPQTWTESFVSACYVTGTRIATPAGEVAVEHLRIGDLVTTSSGVAKPVKWIGRRSHSAAAVAEAVNLRPVVIRKGALAAGLPCRDLVVSPMHALLIDDLLVPAATLVNGVSIVRRETAGAVEYLHIELDRHEVIFAEGAPAETFVDDNSRAMFENASEYYDLYGFSEPPCGRFASRLEEGYRLETIRRRLAARAGIAASAASYGALVGHVERLEYGMLEGWVMDGSNPMAPVELDVLVDGGIITTVLANRYRVDLDRAGLAAGCCGFTLVMPTATEDIARIEVRRAGDGWPVAMPSRVRITA